MLRPSPRGCQAVTVRAALKAGNAFPALKVALGIPGAVGPIRVRCSPPSIDWTEAGSFPDRSRATDVEQDADECVRRKTRREG
jgi:hypothetical protein